LAELGGGRETLDSDGTLESLERQYIIRVLRDTGGLIAGPRGAAVRLGMKRTTLQSRILKMGISREEYENDSGRRDTFDDLSATVPEYRQKKPRKLWL